MHNPVPSTSPKNLVGTAIDSTSQSLSKAQDDMSVVGPNSKHVIHSVQCNVALACMTHLSCP